MKTLEEGAQAMRMTKRSKVSKKNRKGKMIKIKRTTLPELR